MSMRVREKTHKKLYPHWSRQDSPARQCKARDGYKCVVCGIEDRTLVYVDGEPHHFMYLYAAHMCPLDPQYELIEPIEDQRLQAMCPRHAREYDVYWKPRWEAFEHERRLHGILLSCWLPDPWIAKRFLTVV